MSKPSSAKRPHGNRGKAAPSHPPKFTKLVQTRVTPDLYKRITIYAREESISVSAYIRRLLANHVPGGV